MSDPRNTRNATQDAPQDAPQDIDDGTLQRQAEAVAANALAFESMLQTARQQTAATLRQGNTSYDVDQRHYGFALHILKQRDKWPLAKGRKSRTFKLTTWPEFDPENIENMTPNMADVSRERWEAVIFPAFKSAMRTLGLETVSGEPLFGQIRLTAPAQSDNENARTLAKKTFTVAMIV